MSNIKFAIIGCGKVAPKHAESIKKIDKAELVAVCDVKEEKARVFANKYKCNYFKDYKELLKKQKDVDCINICTPHKYHAEITINSAKAGKHVVTEKPMCSNINEANKMIEVCKKFNVKLFVVKQNRYSEPIKKLKYALDESRFGDLYYANATVYWNRPQEYYNQQILHGTNATDVGVLTNQASHHIDMLQWLVGDIKSIKATTTTLTHNIKAEDIGLAILKFKNGALGTIVATTSVFPKNLEGSITIMGEKGTVKVGGTALNKIELWHFEDWNNEDELIAKSLQNPPNVYAFCHFEYLKDVVSSIENNISPKVDGVEGKKTLQLITKIYESAKANKEITL